MSKQKKKSRGPAGPTAPETSRASASQALPKKPAPPTKEIGQRQREDPSFAPIACCALAGALIGAVFPLHMLGPENPTPDQLNALRLICAPMAAALLAFLGSWAIALLGRFTKDEG